MQKDGASGSDLILTPNGPPEITVPGAQTIGAGEATAISAVSLSETGNTSGETFTATLTDTSYGDLSATGTGRPGSGTTA